MACDTNARPNLFKVCWFFRFYALGLGFLKRLTLDRV